MIKHIVMFRFKPFALGNTKEQNLIKAKKEIEALKDRIVEIEAIEAGINTNESETAADLVVYSVFKTAQDLLDYQNHPVHQQLLKFLNEVSFKRTVVDYQT